MTELVRITPHPTERDIVILKCSSEVNEAMGLFEPARLAPDLGGYLLFGDHIGALYRWGHFNDIRVVDERGHGNRGPARPPVECRSCGQPGCLTNQPRRCPACGGEWVGIAPPVRTAPRNLSECPRCRHKQTGTFPFCSHCGTDMPIRVSVVATPVLVDGPREHLDDPLPLSELMPEIPAAKQPELPPTLSDRPVEDVEIPPTLSEPTDETPDVPTLAEPEPEPDDRVLCAYHESKRYNGATCLPGCGGPTGGGCARVAADQAADDRADYCNAASPDAPIHAPEPSKPEPRPAHLVTDGVLTRIHTLFTEYGITDRDDKLGYCATVIDRPVASTKELTRDEAAEIRDRLQRAVNEERRAAARRTGEAADGGVVTDGPWGRW